MYAGTSLALIGWMPAADFGECSQICRRMNRFTSLYNALLRHLCHLPYRRRAAGHASRFTLHKMMQGFQGSRSTEEILINFIAKTVYGPLWAPSVQSAMVGVQL